MDRSLRLNDHIHNPDPTCGVDSYGGVPTPGRAAACMGAAATHADNTIYVTTTQQEINDNVECSLQEAIYSANFDDNVAIVATNPDQFVDTACVAGNGHDTILLPAGAVFPMGSVVDDAHNPFGPTATPIVTSAITIETNGARLEHMPNGVNFRAFAVLGEPGGFVGNLTIRNAWIRGFTTKGGNGAAGGGGGLGAGGAIYVRLSSLTVENRTFEGNGAVATAGTCGGNGNDRTISYTTFAAAANHVIDLSAALDFTVPDGTVITNTASVSTGSPADPNAANDTASASVTVQNRSDLLLTQSVKKLTSRQLRYTVTVKNLGPYQARRIELNDPMPNGTKFVSVSPGSWSCEPLPGGSVGTLSCSLASLDLNASATLVFTVKTTAPGSVNISNTAAVSPGTFDPNLANNSATLVTRVSGK
jgi:uncharacterized repeat protein (TIGR01451 family)